MVSIWIMACLRMDESGFSQRLVKERPMAIVGRKNKTGKSLLKLADLGGEDGI